MACPDFDYGFEDSQSCAPIDKCIAVASSTLGQVRAYIDQQIADALQSARQTEVDCQNRINSAIDSIIAGVNSVYSSIVNTVDSSILAAISVAAEYLATVLGRQPTGLEGTPPIGVPVLPSPPSPISITVEPAPVTITGTPQLTSKVVPADLAQIVDRLDTIILLYRDMLRCLCSLSGTPTEQEAGEEQGEAEAEPTADTGPVAEGSMPLVTKPTFQQLYEHI